MPRIIINVNKKGESSIVIEGKIPANEVLGQTIGAAMMHMYYNEDITPMELFYHVTTVSKGITDIIMMVEAEQDSPLDDEMEGILKKHMGDGEIDNEKLN